MHKICTVLSILAVLVLLTIGLAYSQEAEPNDFFKTAQPLLDNTTPQCNFSSATDVDIFRMEMSTDSIYHIYSDSSDLPASVHVELFFGADTTKNIFNGSPDGRAGWGDFRVAGWVPNEYGSGTYYLRCTPSGTISAPFTGDYRIRLISQNKLQWVNLHEPDNTFQEAFGQFPLPIDGSRFSGMVYNMNDLPSGKDDIDIFYMVGQQGKRLWVETEPVQGNPHTRDMDSDIYIWDGDGTTKLIDNDDKSDQEEDFGENNVFSLCVIDSLPYDGLFYVILTSYYAAYNNGGVTQHSDQDPSTGGYVAYAWMGEYKNEIEPNDAAESATPLCEAVTGQRIGAKNNLVINAQFSSDGDADWYALNLKSTKMYSFNTANSSVGANVNLEVYSKDDPGTNLITSGVNGRYGSQDFRLSGWIPPKDGIYLLKLSVPAGAVGGANTGAYQLRMGWATYRSASLANEPANETQAGAVPVAIDSSVTVSVINPAGDVDYYSFEGAAGDIIDVELFSGMDADGLLWARDMDSFLTLIDPSGNAVENDDYQPGPDRLSNNVFSAVKGYTLQASGTVYIKVECGYKNWNNVGNNPVGTYRMIVYSSAASPAFTEREKNDTFPLAMQLPEGKEVLAKFAQGGVPSANDIDVFKLPMVTSRMYFVNSLNNDLGANIHVELYAETDTLTNLLDTSVDGRYNSNNFRLSGYLPPADGTYYLKLTCPTPGGGNYSIRARSSDLAEVGVFHEPDNTKAEADAKGDYPIDGVAWKGALYNAADPMKENDVDVFRFTCTKGQMLVAKVAPVAGDTWFRDTDTIMILTNAAGDTVADSDDVLGTFSEIAKEIPADGVYYLYLAAYYGAFNNRDATYRNPGIGDYLLTVSGTMAETEPNNSAAEANLIPIADNNLVDAKFATDDLVDWFKVNLEAGKLYYFNTTDSKVGENIAIEVFAESAPTTNLIDNSGFGRFGSRDFRLSGWTPPATGAYLLKLSVGVGAINDQNTGTYKLRAAGGEVLTEVAALHEPDNSRGQANAQAKLLADGAPVKVAFGDNADFDIFAIDGVQGYSLEVVMAPSHGPRWIRELDCNLRVLDQDSTILGENDDWDDWYELNFYLGDVSNTYSRVKIDSLPYTGTYYADAMPYYGAHRGGTTKIGDNAVGSYLIWAKTNLPTGVKDKEDMMPTEFALAQNYPNPFNPTTTILYQLKENVHVTLAIYNVMGQKVATLVDQNQHAGNYSLQWNAMDQYGQKVSSGMYFYRLEAGDKFIRTKKMLLMK